MGSHISHVLEIVWINASQEISKKFMALEFLCFLMRFPYCENSLFQVFENAWISVSREICNKPIR